MHRRTTILPVPSESLDYRTPRYSEPRKKLQSRFSKGVNEQDIARDYLNRKAHLQDYVKETFKRKECVSFVPKKNPKAKPNDPDKCHCGEVLEKHIKWTSGVNAYFDKGIGVLNNDVTTGAPGYTWSAKNDIKEFTTNAFGKIDFINEGIGGHKPAKYVRVADDTSIDDVISLMVDHWNMTKPHEPNLIITVIGGAKNFKLDGKKKDIFNEGLVAAAQTTHAWIITSGCNMGVMKAVGEAVAEGQTYNWDRFGMSHTLRCIGIAPWGYVEKNGVLVSRDGQGLWNASYKVNNIIRHLHPVSLNANHTHFLLVDDGMRGRYGGVADFRAALEKKICTPVTDGGMGKHVVLVVVEGGTDAITDVSRSLKQKIPVVLCEGTGRAADILSYAYNHFLTTRKNERKINPKHKRLIEDMLVRAYGKTWEERSNVEEEQAKYIKLVCECCQDEKLITVFDMNKNEDLDLAILAALLKGQGATDAEQLHEQLVLALTWNRSDVAEEKIFNKDIQWPQGKLDDIMTKALVEDKVNFVKLLLSNGVIMREYLTVEKLRDLYNTAPKSGHLYYFLKSQSRFDKFTLYDVDKLLHRFLGKHDDVMYKEDDHMQMMKSKTDDNTPKFFKKPFRELFLWAVLMNRQDLARFLWERGDEAIPSAIIASKLYLSLAENVANYDHDMKDVYLQNKQEFEQLAVKVLDECHYTDPEKAANLIERKYTTWGGMNCLQLASSADDKEFLSSVACQNSLNLAWKRGISSNVLKVFICILFPPLIFCILDFEDTGEHSGTQGCNKLLRFYRAPRTKFYANVFMYILFLLLYTFVILFDFRTSISIAETFLLLWILTMALEEIREMFFLSESENLIERLKVWWNFSAFNRIDLLIILVALLGVILRFIPGYYNEAKTAYSVNVVLFFVRILSYYSASSYLGPKLVMINSMMRELMQYIMILLVFLLAYGISSQALQYPIRKFSFKVLYKDIFYYPYWQIYGELFLEELEGRTDECRVNDTTGVLMSDDNPCPQYSWLVPALTAGYLLIGNVLLLNLLIAIFTHVFEEIEQNSIQIWKFGMYFLVVEYDVKPGLAPPFVIFEHIFLVIRWLCRMTCCKPEKEASRFNGRLLDLLTIFEKEMQKIYIQKTQAIGKDTLELTINKIRNRYHQSLYEEEYITLFIILHDYGLIYDFLIDLSKFAAFEGAILEIFEKECQKQYFRKRILTDQDSLKRRIIAINNRVDEVSKLLEEERMLEHHQNEAEMNKRGTDSHDSPSHSKAHAKSPRGSSADLKKLVVMSEETSKKEWNLNVINPSEATSLESKPAMFKEIEDMPVATIQVPVSPKLQPSASPTIERKVSNLIEQARDGNRTDVDNAAVDDDTYDRLDHQRLKQSQHDPNYGSAQLLKAMRQKNENSDSEEETKKKKRNKKKKKDSNKDDYPKQPRGNFPYETLNGGQDDQFRDTGIRAPTPPPVPEDRRAAAPPPGYSTTSSSTVGQTTPPPPSFHPPPPPTSAAYQRQQSDVEGRLAQLEQNTQNKLENIEILLRNMRFGPEPVTGESTYQNVPRQPVAPAQGFSTSPTARVALGGPLGGYPAPSQPVHQPRVAYGGASAATPMFHHQQRPGNQERPNTSTILLPRYMDSNF